MSVAQDGASGSGMSMEPGISADGRWIIFESSADDLVPEIDGYTGENIADTNGMIDIFVYDRQSESIRRVNLSSDGEQSNNNSSLPGISADGRWVVFWSLADNLVPGAGRGIYLYDRSTETMQFIIDGFAPTISPDSPLAGDSSEWGQQVFFRDQKAETFALLSAAPNGLPGNNSSASPSLSANGRLCLRPRDRDNRVGELGGRAVTKMFRDCNTTLQHRDTFATRL